MAALSYGRPSPVCTRCICSKNHYVNTTINQQTIQLSGNCAMVLTQHTRLAVYEHCFFHLKSNVGRIIKI